MNGFLAATTRRGLARLIGVSYDTVRRGLKVGFVSGGKWSSVVHVAEVELEKVGGERGKGKKDVSGFLGMKGSDGLKKGIE